MHRSHATILPSSNSLLTLWSQSLSAEATCKTRKYLNNTWFSLIRRPSTNVEADFEERLNILLPHVHFNSLPYIDKSHSMTFPSIAKRNKAHLLAELLDNDNLKMKKKISNNTQLFIQLSQQRRMVKVPVRFCQISKVSLEILPCFHNVEATSPQAHCCAIFLFHLVGQLTRSPQSQILFDCNLYFSICLSCSRNIRRIV